MLSKRSESDRTYMVTYVFFPNFQLYFTNHMVLLMIFCQILNIAKFIWYPLWISQNIEKNISRYTLYFSKLLNTKTRLVTTVDILDRFQRLISKECKNWTKIARGIIFFSSESWDSILFKYVNGGTAGGLGEALF